MTAYLRNYWYLAAWAQEIVEKPLGRTLFGKPMVIFRTESGQAAILEDICPHRFAALHPGRVIGETIECPYHGLRFGTDGQCSHSPFSEKPPRAQKVTSHPVHEEDGFIWFWYGDADKATCTPVPDLGFARQTPTTEFIRAYNHMNADFMLGIDNLLELSHVGFLHRDSFSQGTDTLAQSFINGTFRSYEDEGKIVSHWKFSDEPGAYAQTQWQAPTLCIVEKGFDHSIPPRERRMIGLHLFTPETEKSTHYFAVETYDTMFDAPDYAEQVATLTKKAFVEEDVATIELIQRNMGDGDLLDLSPLLLPIDSGTFRTRRAYRHLLDLQESEAARHQEVAHA